MSKNTTPFSPAAKASSIIAFVIVLPVMAAILLSLMGLPVKGFEWLGAEKVAPEKVEAQAVAVVDFTRTPAGQVFDRTFTALDRQWTPMSTKVLSAGLPHPLNCVTPAPTLSHSQAYKTGSSDAQLTLAAYPAGVGAPAFRKLVDETVNCKPSGTSIYTSVVSDLGMEAVKIQSSWAENRVEITAFRRGDLIAFSVTDAGEDSTQPAKEVDQLLKKALTPKVCANQLSGVKDQYRNVMYAGGGFTGLQAKAPLQAEKVPAPELTEEERAKGIKPVKLKRVKGVELVTLPDASASYPLWPPLPEVAPYPTPPTVPAKQKLESSATVRIDDPVGPGCGWSFLTTLTPKYDELQIIELNEAVINSAQQALDADGPRWQAAVAQYWTNYATYLKKVNTYENYRSEVASVAKLWASIHRAWDKYYTEFANWEIRDNARTTLIANQEAAEELWQEQKQSCKDYRTAVKEYKAAVVAYDELVTYYEENPEEFELLYEEYLAALEAWKLDKRPKEEKGEKPVDPTPVKPVAPEKLDFPCPAVKPVILDEKVPAKEKAPKKPADPRPESERD